MSHSQFRRRKTYTETCMDESLRQAYDYWQDQPGSIRRIAQTCVRTIQLHSKLSSTCVNFFMLTHKKAKICFRTLDDSNKACSSSRKFAIYTELALRSSTWLRDCSSRNLSIAGVGYVKRTNTSSLTLLESNSGFIRSPPSVQRFHRPGHHCSDQYPSGPR